MRNVFVAGKEPEECAPLLRGMVADRASEHRVAGFERVKNRPLRRRAFDGNPDLAVDAGQRSQMERQDDANHGNQGDGQSPPLR
jgi:hypothetical protein